MKNKFTIALSALLIAGSAMAQSEDIQTQGVGDAPGSYIPGIWVDPDGCQHWVMDLGIEGMMDSVLTKEGKPVCGANCAQLQSDVLFAVNGATLSAAGQTSVANVASQLRSRGKNSVGVVGHTDSDGSTQFNDSLSLRRAQAVATALRKNGVSAASVSGRGESQPIASNSSEAGKQQNRRVELICR